MSDKSISSEFRVDVGRADRGRTFVRVVHIPTGKEKALVGLGQADPNEVAFQLTRELTNEIDAETIGRNPSSVGSSTS